jgi:hypothetical protein
MLSPQVTGQMSIAKGDQSHLCSNLKCPGQKDVTGLNDGCRKRVNTIMCLMALKNNLKLKCVHGKYHLSQRGDSSIHRDHQYRGRRFRGRLLSDPGIMDTVGTNKERSGLAC